MRLPGHGPGGRQTNKKTKPESKSSTTPDKKIYLLVSLVLFSWVSVSSARARARRQASNKRSHHQHQHNPGQEDLSFCCSLPARARELPMRWCVYLAQLPQPQCCQELVLGHRKMLRAPARARELPMRMIYNDHCHDHCSCACPGTGT